MLSQALAACLIYWLLGMNNIVFWAFVTAVCGLIPMVGTVIVSVPLGAYMIYSGELWQGILMIALGVLVIANVDNLCRMILMNKVADRHFRRDTRYPAIRVLGHYLRPSADLGLPAADENLL